MKTRFESNRIRRGELSWAVVLARLEAHPEALDALRWMYELCGNASVEWYDCVNGEKTDPDYHSAIWVPVKRKE